VRGVAALAGLAVAVCTNALSGCTHAPPLKDRYACIQQAQPTRSVASINQGTGGAYSAVVVSQDVFMSCMGARGYTLDPIGRQLNCVSRHRGLSG
jgi:hypothetical protein